MLEISEFFLKEMLPFPWEKSPADAQYIKQMRTNLLSLKLDELDESGVPLSNLEVVRSLRTKQQVQPQNKSVYIELGKSLRFLKFGIVVAGFLCYSFTRNLGDNWHNAGNFGKWK